MWQRGQIPGYQLHTGTVIIDPPEFRTTPVRTVAVYARVSSRENKDNLERQAERLISWCNAQGGEFLRSSKRVAEASMSSVPSFWHCSALPKIGQLVVEHKDRASCFGVAFIQTVLARPRTGTGHGQYC